MATLKQPINDFNAKCTISSDEVDLVVSSVGLLMRGAQTKDPGTDFAEIVRQFLLHSLEEADEKAFWRELRAENDHAFKR